MGTTNTTTTSNIFENLSLTFTDYTDQDDWFERKVSKRQKLNRHARNFARSMKQTDGE